MSTFPTPTPSNVLHLQNRLNRLRDAIADGYRPSYMAPRPIESRMAAIRVVTGKAV